MLPWPHLSEPRCSVLGESLVWPCTVTSRATRGEGERERERGRDTERGRLLTSFLRRTPFDREKNTPASLHALILKWQHHHMHNSTRCTFTGLVYCHSLKGKNFDLYDYILECRARQERWCCGYYVWVTFESWLFDQVAGKREESGLDFPAKTTSPPPWPTPDNQHKKIDAWNIMLYKYIPTWDN